MEELNQKFREARSRLNLSIEEVSEKTKIRPHIIKSIEDGKFDVLPNVYLQSFIKTYAKFLKIQVPQINDIKSTKLSFDDKFPITETSKDIKIPEVKAPKKIKDDGDKNYKELFKKHNKISPKANIVNYLIYAALSLTVIALFYFTFFSGHSGRNNSLEMSDTVVNKNDTTIIKSEDKGLFSFFQKSDSLTLEASASDTAWLKIDIDGKSQQELMMTPGMNKVWAANEYFIITQGNVGAIRFSRNGSPIEMLGQKGSVVKNVKITRENVINQSPWAKYDSTSQRFKTDSNTMQQFRKKKKINVPPKLIEESPIKTETPKFKKR